MTLDKSSIEELQRAAFESFKPWLGEHGYTLNSKAQFFSKRTKNGRALIHFAFLRLKDSLSVAIDVAVRSDFVERKLSSIRFSHGVTATIGAELGNLRELRPMRWDLSAANGTLDFELGGVAACEEYAFPFVARYESDEAIYVDLLSDDVAARIVSPNVVKRNLSVLALSESFAGTSQERERVIQVCYARVLSVSDAELMLFKRFADPLLSGGS